MSKRVGLILAFVIVFLAGFLVSRLTPVGEETRTSGTGWAAVPGEKGGQDQLGPYEAVEGWPKPMTRGLATP